MPIVESSIFINLPSKQVFALTQDYYVRLEWDPFLRDLKFLDGAKEAAVGVRVAVKAWTGLTMEVEYLSLKEPEVVAVKMIKGPFFFEHFTGTWRFTAESENRTKVIFRYNFKTRWRLLCPILDPVIKRVFTHDITARLRELKKAAEETDIISRLGKITCV